MGPTLGHFSRYDQAPFRHNTPRETVFGLISNLGDFFSFALFYDRIAISSSREAGVELLIGLLVAYYAMRQFSPPPFSQDFPGPCVLNSLCPQCTQRPALNFKSTTLPLRPSSKGQTAWPEYIRVCVCSPSQTWIYFKIYEEEKTE